MGVAAAVAGVGAVASIGGSLISANATSKAAAEQQQEANAALAQQAAATQWSQGNQQPFITAGQNALANQSALANGFTSSINPYLDAMNSITPGTLTQKQLEATPGYQFTLSQGLQSNAANNAAKGLGVSGAALKGGAAYATNLANTTYNTDFQQQQTQYQDAANRLSNALSANQQQYNQLQGIVNTGANTSVSAGSQANQGAANAGSIDTSLGNAQGAASIAQGNALSGGLSGVSNAGQNYYGNTLLSQYLGNNSSGVSNQPNFLGQMNSSINGGNEGTVSV